MSSGGLSGPVVGLVVVLVVVRCRGSRPPALAFRLDQTEIDKGRDRDTNDRENAYTTDKGSDIVLSYYIAP